MCAYIYIYTGLQTLFRHYQYMYICICVHMYLCMHMCTHVIIHYIHVIYNI